MIKKTSAGNTIKKTAFLALAAVIMALTLRTFCAAAGIIPGGFTGIAVLFNEIMQRYFGIQLPFSIVYYILNAFPVYIGFRYIGKWFTFYSCIMVFLTGVFTDSIPASVVSYLNLHDHLLCAVFGGIINAIAITICLLSDATSGGTDFIAIYYAEKQGRDAWGIIFAANCVVLAVAAWLFEPEKALYSIIFQFTTTMGLKSLYKGYQRKTLLIITEKHDEVYALIRDVTNHDATLFSGIGKYKNASRSMLYSVVSANEIHTVITGIKNIDPQAFINVLKTDALIGQFYRRPKK